MPNRRLKKRSGPKNTIVNLTRQPSTVIVLTGAITVTLATSNLQTVALSSSTWLGSRFAAFAAAFLNIRIKRLVVEPINMPAASYIEYALMPSHLPALLSAFDATPLAPSVIGNVMTLPGAARAQQGNGMPPRAVLKYPKTMQFACSRVNTDLPPIAFLVCYGSNNTNFNVYTEVVLSGYTAFL
jgi:hypothetical protein